jgi:hypothetical protein
LSHFNETRIFSAVSKKAQILDFIKIHPVGAGLFHAGGQTDMTTLTFARGNFANMPKNGKTSKSLTHFHRKV